MSKNSLPTEWVKVTIGDLFCLVGGGTPDTKTSHFWSGKIPWITSADIEKTGVIRAGRYVTAKGIRNSATHLVPKNTIIVATRVGLGKTGIASSRMCFSQDCQGLISDSALIDPKFSMYQLMQATQGYMRIARGTTISGITKKQLAETIFLLPPRKEQSRIVNSIECLLSEIESATARLHHIKSNLKRYRASVLQAAVEGRLTAEWRRHHPPSETGEQLLARILKERRAKWEENQLKKYAEQGRTPPKNWQDKYPEPVKPDTMGLPELPELPEGWVWVSIDQLAFVVRGASPRPAGDARYFNGSIPWITVAPLTANNSPYLKEVQNSLTEEGAKHSRYIEPYTLLLSNSGATLGVPKITTIGGCINDGVAALLGLDCDLKKYALYFLRTKTKRLRAINQGAAQPNLNTNIIKAIVMPIPSRNEVKAIVDDIEHRLDITGSSEKAIDSALQRAAQLRQSILKRAFEGRLVPQDPNDEPASVLLERIRAARIKQTATVKPARAKSKGKDHQVETSTGENGIKAAETA